MNKIVLCQLAEKLQKLGESLGFGNHVIRTSSAMSEIYVVNRHALQLEIDWRENDLFMYAVYLKDKKLPPELILPAATLRADGDLFLDDKTPQDISTALNVKATPSEDEGELFIKKILGI